MVIDLAAAAANKTRIYQVVSSASMNLGKAAKSKTYAFNMKMTTNFSQISMDSQQLVLFKTVDSAMR